MLGVETPVGNHHDHGQVMHLGMELKEASRLSKQPVLEPGFALHLHLQQHHRLLRRAALATARPEGTIEAVVGSLELRRLKAVDRIPRRIRPQAGRGCTTRQQQRDQIRRALEQAVKPVIRFHGSAYDLLQQEPPRHDHDSPNQTA